MNDQPFVSIIINNYNYDRFLTEAIDSADDNLLKVALLVFTRAACLKTLLLSQLLITPDQLPKHHV